MIGEGGDTTIPSPGRPPKQPLPEIGLYGPLDGRQACPEFNSCYQGVGQKFPGRGCFRAVPFQNGDKFVTSPPPQSMNDSSSHSRFQCKTLAQATVLVRKVLLTTADVELTLTPALLVGGGISGCFTFL